MGDICITVELYMEGDRQMVWLAHDEGCSGAKYQLKRDLSDLGEKVQEYVNTYVLIDEDIEEDENA